MKKKSVKVIERNLFADIEQTKTLCWRMQSTLERFDKGEFPELEEIFKLANNNKRTLLRRKEIFDKWHNKNPNVGLVTLPKDMKALIIEMAGLVYYVEKMYTIFWIQANKVDVEYLG